MCRRERHTPRHCRPVNQTLTTWIPTYLMLMTGKILQPRNHLAMHSVRLLRPMAVTMTITSHLQSHQKAQ
ncbi:hypothetical protein NP493_742g01023 [Ridgeia piscesae]|uniref:Uncharacterized protein n=1 Tax=Ridgeia piscesae TaxID=27915 RepID=A0AAD9KPD3_RIDPI|nr:hypothetical protein NP493_742g01023 [Ridgeia piscesae]